MTARTRKASTTAKKAPARKTTAAKKTPAKPAARKTATKRTQPRLSLVKTVPDSIRSLPWMTDTQGFATLHTRNRTRTRTSRRTA